MRDNLYLKLMQGEVKFEKTKRLLNSYCFLDSDDVLAIELFLNQIEEFYYLNFNISDDFFGKLYVNDGEIYCDLKFDASDRLFDCYCHHSNLQDVVNSFNIKYDQNFSLSDFDLEFFFHNQGFKYFNLKNAPKEIESDGVELFKDYIQRFFIQFRNSVEFEFDDFSIMFNGIDFEISLIYRDSNSVKEYEKLFSH